MSSNFKYTIEGKERCFFIGSYSLEKTFEDLNISYSDVSNLAAMQQFKLLRAMIFYSAEYSCLLTKQEIDFTSHDVYGWIDSTGGVNGGFVNGFTKAMLPAMGVSTDVKKGKQKTVKS